MYAITLHPLLHTERVLEKIRYSKLSISFGCVLSYNLYHLKKADFAPAQHKETWKPTNYTGIVKAKIKANHKPAKQHFLKITGLKLSF